MSHLDDLPERTDDHVGETENREAFRVLFKDPYFLIREEHERDYGVDYGLIVGVPTRCLAADGHVYESLVRTRCGSLRPRT